MLNSKSILITGGTGSFGRKFVGRVLSEYPDVKRLVIYSRDELKQYEMQQEFSHINQKSLRFFIGDVRDEQRLKMAMEGIDVVVHAAALKQVPTAEYNPFECIKTNVIGAENVIRACLSEQVETVIALSTDKAAAPINLYGASKLCSDKLFVAANNMTGKRRCRFSVVRYGNVMGSRGSVIPFFLDRRHSGVLPITHPDMTRFNITLDDGVDLVFHAISNRLGGEIFVPKIPSYRIVDVAQAIGPQCQHEIVGIRPGEKLHEEMVTDTDSLNTIETRRHYIIVPSSPFVERDQMLEKFCDFHRGTLVETGFAYSSDKNDQWLTVGDLRHLIKFHVDPTFIALAAA